MMALKRTWVVVAAVSALGVFTAEARAQQTQSQTPTRTESQGTERFQLKLGAIYDQGDFGTRDITRTFFAPVTFKYLGDAFDVGITTGYVRVDSAGGVTLVEGEPTPSGNSGGRRIDEGLADTVLKARWFAIDDPGLSKPWPSLTPFGKIKFPTGDEAKGLSTGEFDFGIGFEFDKQLPADFFVFGDFTYTFIGDQPHRDFRDRQAFSVGVGRRFTRTLTVSGFYEFRRAIVSGEDDSHEIGAIVSYKFTPTLTLSPIVTAGLSHGAPDFSVGMELAWKFGRY
jgi:Putative MetA-pathway of phenol degradation